MFKTYSWIARCGEECWSQKGRCQHQAQCPKCQAIKKENIKVRMSKICRKPRPQGWKARCGILFSKKEEMYAHYTSGCDECSSAKRTRLKAVIDTLAKSKRKKQGWPCECGASLGTRKLWGEHKRGCATHQERISALNKIRSDTLARWKRDNQEEWAKQTYQHKKSKPEQWLKSYLKWDGGLVPCGSDNKQVDLVCDNIWIEVDGPFHFWPIFQIKKIPMDSKFEKILARTQGRDEMLNQEAIARGNVCLIRMSVDCFFASGPIRASALEELNLILKNPQPGYTVSEDCTRSPKNQVATN